MALPLSNKGSYYFLVDLHKELQDFREKTFTAYQIIINIEENLYDLDNINISVISNEENSLDVKSLQNLQKLSQNLLLQ